jgi:hypothetical protein
VTDLIEFLKARIQEDEGTARAVQAPYRLYVYDDGQVREPEIEDHPDSDNYGTYRRDFYGDDILPNRHQGYALLYDPARVLREVEAKRRVMDRHCADTPPYFQYCRGCGDNGPQLNECPELRDLAAAYSDHADWRDEWRPN